MTLRLLDLAAATAAAFMELSYIINADYLKSPVSLSL